MLKFTVVIVLACAIVLFSEGADSRKITDYLSDPLYSCVQCLCHARTGCWRRRNCASYSISKDYWKKAGSLVVSADDDPNNDSSYQKCMLDENCIVGTVIEYTRSWGMQMDCNCDGIFDCKDMAAIHLFGQKCERPMFGEEYANRFNHCAAKIGVREMRFLEGDDQCTVPEVY
ncbi:hypothetical protein JTB14_032080 [Gonioctena quinquepunctata]|nr:hypothetical protein JTB14_032080 [Gonioctena quinquepunctata]